MNIPRLRNIFFQPHDIGFAILVHLVDADVVGLLVENNINKPIYISWKFCFGQVQELTYPNIDQLYHRKAGLAKKALYSQYKKAWLDKMIIVCYAVYEKQQPTVESQSPIITKIDIVLPHRVSFYRFLKQAIDQLSRLITIYNSIWYDKDFAKLPVEN